MKRYLGIFLPGLLSVALFGATVFWLILPRQEQALLEKERHLVQELTLAARSLVASYEAQVSAGLLSREEAQSRVLQRLRQMRYGEESKDYFFVLTRDMRMLAHPYRPDLEGRDVSSFVDSHGTYVFREMAQRVNEQGGGDVSYFWQWKDDPSKLAQKLSHVILFEPWGWIIGSGLYLDDVRREMAVFTRDLTLAGLVVMLLVSLLAGYISWRSLREARERQRAQDSLQESEERFRSISDNASDAIIMMDPQGRVSFWNRAAETILGYASREALGQEVHKLLAAPDDTGRQAQGLALFRATGQGPVLSRTIELNAIKKGGQEIPVELSIAPLHLHGQWHAVGIVRDISQRKMDERTLRQKAEELSLLNTLGRDINSQLSLKHTSRAALRGIMATLGPDEAFLFMLHGNRLILTDLESRTNGKLHPTSRPEHRLGECLCGLAAQENRPLFSSDIAQDARCTWRECREAGLKSFAALPLRHGDEVLGVVGLASRQHRDFAQQAEFLETLTGQVSVAVANARLFEAAQQELAERLRVEQDLQVAKEQFQNLSEKSPIGIGLNDQEGRVQYLNPAFVDMFGYTLEDIPTRDDWFRLAYPDPVDRKKVLDAWQEDLASHALGVSMNRTFQVTCKDGRKKVIHFRAVLLPSGDVLRLYEDITEFSQAQEELKRNEATLRSILQASPSGIAMVGFPDRTVLWANDRLAEMTGYPLEEVIGRPGDYVYSNREDFLRVGQMIRQGVQLSGMGAIETQWVRKDGTIIDVLINISPLNANRPEEGLVYNALEITHSKRAQEEIRKSEATLKSILQASPSGIGMFGIPGNNFLWVNDKLAEMTGYSMADLIGHPSSMLYLDEEKLRASLAMLRGALLRNGVSRIQDKWVRKDGSIIDVLINTSAVKPGDLSQGVVFNALDITEYILAEKRLRESEAQYRLILEATPDPVVLYDMDGRVIYLNPAFTRVFGWTQEELVGRVIDYVPAGETQRTNELIELLREGKNLNGMETKRLDRQGNVLDISLSWSVWKDDSGHLVGSVVVLRDVTEQKKVLAQLEQARKMEAIGNLAGGIAHDFNNALQAIAGNVQLIIYQSNIDVITRDRLINIDKLTQRASEFIQQLLAVSRKQEVKLKPLDLNHEIRQVIRLLERILPKMVRLELDLSPDLGMINGDAVQLEQIILNLATNSVDAMPHGGELTFITENQEIDEVFCRAHPELCVGPHIVLQVRDTGVGMDAETAKHIFEPFFTTKQDGKGTGLGLATVYGIVDRHNGFISCYSEPGVGTIFKIYLPAIISAEQIDTDRAPACDIDLYGRGETVLLVDDEEPILEVGVEMLKMFGYQVITASSGEEALDLYKSRDGGVDLVIMDLNMPGMGGHRGLEALLLLNPSVKVIISSGYRSPEVISQLEKAGASGFVGKPYRLSDMAQKVKTILTGATC